MNFERPTILTSETAKQLLTGGEGTEIKYIVGIDGLVCYASPDLMQSQILERSSIEYLPTSRELRFRPGVSDVGHLTIHPPQGGMRTIDLWGGSASVAVVDFSRNLIELDLPRNFDELGRAVDLYLKLRTEARILACQIIEPEFRYAALERRPTETIVFRYSDDFVAYDYTLVRSDSWNTYTPS